MESAGLVGSKRSRKYDLMTKNAIKRHCIQRTQMWNENLHNKNITKQNIELKLPSNYTNRARFVEMKSRMEKR